MTSRPAHRGNAQLDHDACVAADDRVTISVDGAPVEARRGQSIAGALLAGGSTAWRGAARDGRPRGLFCGIGVCFECLVTVDGAPDVRACQRRVAEGQRVATQGCVRGEAAR